MTQSVEFEITEAGMEQFKRDLEERFSHGIHVPLGGCEEDAILRVP